jgi:hypothetical protein
MVRWPSRSGVGDQGCSSPRPRRCLRPHVRRPAGRAGLASPGSRPDQLLPDPGRGRTRGHVEVDQLTPCVLSARRVRRWRSPKPRGPEQVRDCQRLWSSGSHYGTPRHTPEDSNRLSPRGLATRPPFCKASVHGRFTAVSSSPWLYIQSEALQETLFHLQPGQSAVGAVVSTQSRLRFAGPEVGASQPDPGVDRLVADDDYGANGRQGLFNRTKLADGPAKSDPEGWLVKRGS